MFTSCSSRLVGEALELQPIDSIQVSQRLLWRQIRTGRPHAVSGRLTTGLLILILITVCLQSGDAQPKRETFPFFAEVKDATQSHHRIRT